MVLTVKLRQLLFASRALSPIHTADADETTLSSLVASASAVCTWIRDDCRRIRRCERTTQPYGSRLPTGVFTPTTRRNCRQLVANSCTHRRRDETRLDETVSSRRRRRCVLGFTNLSTFCALYQFYLLLTFTLTQCVNYRNFMVDKNSSGFALW